MRKVRIGFLNKKNRWFVSSIFIERNIYKFFTKFATVIEIPFKNEKKINLKLIENLDLDYIYFNIMDCSFYPILYRDLNEIDIPFIFVTHTLTPWILHFLLMAPFLREDDIIVNFSRFAKKQLNKILSGFKSYTINYPLDVPLIRNSISKVSRDPKSLIYVGRITERKNVHTLVSCLPTIKKNFPDFKLNIVGSLAGNRVGKRPTPYVKKLKKSIKKLSLEKNVNFLGIVSETTKFKLIKNSRILVHPTLAIEESTIVVIPEAFVCGTPVVCSYWAGAPEFIKDGKNGFLIDVKWKNNKPKLNKKQLIQAIIKLLEDDKLFRRLSKNAEKSGLSFDYKKSAHKIANLLKVKRKRKKIKSKWHELKNKKVCELKELYNPDILDKFTRNLKFSDLKEIIENRPEVRKKYYKKRFKYMSYQNRHS